MDETMTDAQTDTRKQFVEAARRLFAQRGYYGVSIAAVADELGLTKQALLHHFGSKEKLYGEVLAEISDRFMAVVETIAERDGAPADRMQVVVSALHRHLTSEQDDARIILRELLDNSDRAAQSKKWYLRPFLDAMVDLASRHPRWRRATRDEVFGGIYQLVGAINYFAVSGETLKNVYGADRYAAIASAFPAELARLTLGDEADA